MGILLRIVRQLAAEGGDFQRFGADHHVDDLEAATDDAGAAEGRTYLLGVASVAMS